MNSKEERVRYKATLELIDGVKALMSKYGDLPLSTIIDILHQQAPDDKFHLCPKCNGRGIVQAKYNGYPSGLPDSGWVYEEATKDIKCDLCEGTGYTEKKMVPNMVQDGWKES